ncbi:MAG: tRNA (guanosine(46)-N7)-methyltransferase TrmB [Coxiellaceae bacterium]|nr:tRNA (guanosine(46)-N7)-methyltransferase TrmB [Coxiellaceae bacterium]|tara:strand:+ start:888 stop:1580 length:693 start_codon:yes stop_codon:yes gene_type:complete
MSISQTLQRPIRSFVIRASRMTNRQRHAIEHHWGDYGIDLTDGLEDVTTCFKNAAPVVLEIGFGMGDSLVKLAQSRPDINFIGVEVHPPGVGACVASASEAGLKNLLVIRDDAIEVLQHHVKNHSLHQVQILFPDPWHKKKHHKRRLIQADLISLLARKIIVDGSLRIATDWMPYAEHIESVFHGSSLFVEHQDCHDDMRVQTRINETKFEMRGKRLGHKIVDFWYTRMA